MFVVLYDEGAEEDLRALRAFEARRIWQLRVGDFRVFYDVDRERRQVIVRAVRRKGTRNTKEVL